MSVTKIIKNIQTTIGEEETNPLQVRWDLSYYYDIPADRHEDDTCQMQQEHRDVEKIHRVEIELFGRQGLDITEHLVGPGSSRNLRNRLETTLLETVEDASVEEIAKKEAVR